MSNICPSISSAVFAFNVTGFGVILKPPPPSPAPCLRLLIYFLWYVEIMMIQNDDYIAKID